MIRRVLVMLACTFLVACTPELIPRPTTPQPPTVAPTVTPAAISAPVVPSPGLASIHMLDEQNGWGISDTAVLRTIDGGATWYDVGPKAAAQLGYAADASFLDAQHCWVLVPDPSDMLKGTLYITADGGMNWRTVPVPFGGGDLHILDGKNGWMMASLGAGAGSMGVAIFRTNDGGATWIQAYSNDPNQPGAGASLPLGGMKDGLAAVNMQTAWVGGVIYSPGTIYLYRSNDSGATWQQASLKIPDGYDQAELDTRPPLFQNAHDAYLPVTISSQNGVMLAIYASHDGGASWQQTPMLIPQGGAVDFVTPQDGFVYTGSTFYVTHDGAKTWNTVTPDVNFTDTFSGMDFVSPTTGWVITNDASGAHALYKTTDGGTSWALLSK